MRLPATGSDRMFDLAGKFPGIKIRDDPVQAEQQTAFARAAPAHHRDHLTPALLEVYPVQRRRQPALVFESQTFHRNRMIHLL